MKKLVLVLTQSESGQLQANLTKDGKQAALISEEPDPEDRDLQKSFKASNFYQNLRCIMQASFSLETCEDGFKESYKLFLD